MSHEKNLGSARNEENNFMEVENKNLFSASSDSWPVERLSLLTSPVRNVNLSNSGVGEGVYIRSLSSTKKNDDNLFLYPSSQLKESASAHFTCPEVAHKVRRASDHVEVMDGAGCGDTEHLTADDSGILFRVSCTVTIVLGIFFMIIGSSGHSIRLTDLSVWDSGTSNNSSSSNETGKVDVAHLYFSSMTKKNIQVKTSNNRNHKMNFLRPLSDLGETLHSRRFPFSLFGARSNHINEDGQAKLALRSANALQAIAGIIQNTISRMHYGLFIVGFLSIIVGVSSWISWWAQKEYLFIYCQILYGLLLLVSAILLLLSWIEASELTGSSVDAIEGVWNNTLAFSDIENLCIVERYFVCSGFRSSCPISDQEKPTLRLSAASPILAYPTSPSPSLFSPEPSDSNLCESSCLWNTTLHNHPAGLERSVLGFFLTPEKVVDDSNPFSTSCLERFNSFAGISRTITIIACLSIMVYGCYGLYLFHRVTRALGV